MSNGFRPSQVLIRINRMCVCVLCVCVCVCVCVRKREKDNANEREREFFCCLAMDHKHLDLCIPDDESDDDDHSPIDWSSMARRTDVLRRRPFVPALVAPVPRFHAAPVRGPPAAAPVRGPPAAAPVRGPPAAAPVRGPPPSPCSLCSSSALPEKGRYEQQDSVHLCTQHSMC
jgi:hypothetical protein